MNPESQRILIRGVNWLGDAVMTMPALQRFREAHPYAHITLLTSEKLADLWKNHAALNEVLAFQSGETVFQVARRLRQVRYDLALVLPNSPRSALEAFLGRIPQRVGFARPWRNRLLTQAVPPRAEAVPMHKRTTAEIKRLIASAECGVRSAECGVRGSPDHQPSTINHQPPRVRSAECGTLPSINHQPSTINSPSASPAHQIHDYLHLVAALGADPTPVPPRLSVSPVEVRRVKLQFLRDLPLDIPWFGLNPGAEYGPAKRWPVDHYVQAATLLARRTGCGWLVLGGPKDQPLASEVADGLRRAAVPMVVNLAGKTTLRELCAVFKACALVLTNDTGPMHLAAAVGTPVIVPFGSTSPELTGPGLPQSPDSPHILLRAAVPCAPCFLRHCPIDFRCMRGISVNQIVEAALTVFKRGQ